MSPTIRNSSFFNFRYDDSKKLIFPVKENENVLYYIRESELYEVGTKKHSLLNWSRWTGSYDQRTFNQI